MPPAAAHCAMPGFAFPGQLTEHYPGPVPLRSFVCWECVQDDGYLENIFTSASLLSFPLMPLCFKPYCWSIFSLSRFDSIPWFRAHNKEQREEENPCNHAQLRPCPTQSIHSQKGSRKQELKMAHPSGWSFLKLSKSSPSGQPVCSSAHQWTLSKGRMHQEYCGVQGRDQKHGGVAVNRGVDKIIFGLGVTPCSV